VSDIAISMYLDLLKRCVTNLVYQDSAVRYFAEDPDDSPIAPFSLDRRLTGRDWPSQAHTMIGMHRLNNIQTLVEDILREQVPGDLIETGVWRGGSTIFMRGVLKAYGVSDRTVWVADSFAGPPSRDEDGASSRSFSSPGLDGMRDGLQHKTLPRPVQERLDLIMQGTTYEEVRDRFSRYDLLDDQVRFLRGWFRNTLPSAPIEHLALLRLDGDWYDSTFDALDALYPRLSDGGYVIVDDYNAFEECRRAVHDYLDGIQVDADITQLDEEAVFWKKHDC
jgi:hypothetical protein